MNNQLCSKSTEKYLDISDPGMFSSFKKSERSNIINQNLGSLIFETPPKGKENRNFLSYKLDDVNHDFYRIEISPPAFEEVEEVPN